MILQYHNVTSKHFALSGGRIPFRLFKKQIFSLKRSVFFKFPNLSNYDFLSNKINEVILTFDDGFSSVYEEVFPFLESFGIKGIVFVVAGYLGRKSKWDILLGGFKNMHLNKYQVKNLSDNGWVIGSHSLTHRPLIFLDKKEIYDEVKHSKEILEDIIGREVSLFSYPYGRYNKMVIDVLQEVGYKYAFLSSRGNNGERYKIGRIPIYLIDYNLNYKLQFAFFEDLKERFITCFNLGSLLIYKLRKFI